MTAKIKVAISGISCQGKLTVNELVHSNHSVSLVLTYMYIYTHAQGDRLQTGKCIKAMRMSEMHAMQSAKVFKKYFYNTQKLS